MKIIRLFVLSVSLVFVTAQLSVAAESWQLDRAHSSVSFRVNHVLAKVVGVFADYEVRATLDPENLKESSLYIEIKTDSINTYIPKRDKHLKSGDFFDSGKYPIMSFQSTSVVDEGNGSLRVLGKLEVKGKAYDLTLPVQYLGVVDHPMAKGSQVIGLSIETSLDRLVYGIGNGSFVNKGVVGKDVDVFISVEMLSN